MAAITLTPAQIALDTTPCPTQVEKYKGNPSLYKELMADCLARRKQFLALLRAAPAAQQAQRNATQAYINYQMAQKPPTYEIKKTYNSGGTFTGYQTTGSPTGTGTAIDSVYTYKSPAYISPSSHPATASEPSSTPVASRAQVSSANTLPAGVTTHPVSTYTSPPTGGSTTTTPGSHTGSTVSSPVEIHSAVAPPSWSASSLTTTQWAIILAIVGAAILLLVLTLG